MNIGSFNIDDKIIIGAVSAIIGGVVTRLLTFFQSRIHILSYTVNHNRIGISTEDKDFGTVEVRWQSTQMNNLFVSKVTLRNETQCDFTKLKIKIYSGEETLMLNQQVSIADSTQMIPYTDSYRRMIEIPHGETATENQFDIYYHSREFEIEVLNRGKDVDFTFLTTVLGNAPGPSVWLDIIKEGIQSKYRPNELYVHGVPLRHATNTWIIISLILTVSIVFTFKSAAIIPVAFLIFGLYAQFVGAAVYKSLRTFVRIVINR